MTGIRTPASAGPTSAASALPPSIELFACDIRVSSSPTSSGRIVRGLALMRAGGEELPSTDLVLALLRDAIGPDRARTPVRTPA